ncbi:MAG: tyrosine-type recombinase/integrase [Herpetosiphonaceae bacterium]|nr:tyrosine-type recombinase/integrase [Herpetosiphonaceae bacterium]
MDQPNDQSRALLPEHVNRVDLALATWLHAKAGRSGSRETRLAYAATISTFRKLVLDAGLDLDGDGVAITLLAQQWAGHGEPAPATYNRRLAILSSFYRYAAQQRLLPTDNPITRVERRRVESYAGAQPLDAGDMKDLLKQIDRTTPTGARDYALLAVALQTGRRLSELAALRWSALRIGSDGRVQIHWRRTKGGKVMYDTLPLPLSTALLHYLHRAYGPALGDLPHDAAIWRSFSRNGSQGKALGIQSIADICEKRLGTSKVHTLRHTFARVMEDSGAKVSDIQARLGHASLSTTGRYLAALNRADNAHAESIASRLGLDL